MNFWQNGLEELQLFQPKKPVLEQASPKTPFGRYKTHLFEKKLHFILLILLLSSSSSTRIPLCVCVRERKMGRLFAITLEGRIYSCKHCTTHLALSDDIVSKSFRCKYGMAYLFDKVVNVTLGEKEERLMITGLHTVVDIFCVGCCSIVGWKYEAANERTQKYKEGKFILERFKMFGPDGSFFATPHDATFGSSDADDA